MRTLLLVIMSVLLMQINVFAQATAGITEPTDTVKQTTAVAESVPVKEKGVTFYKDFPVVPDFASFAKVNKDNIAEFPLKAEPFSYLDSSIAEYVYKRQIFDYTGIDYEKLTEYAKYLTKVGFKALKSLEKENLGEWQELITWDLLYDVDFKVKKDGILIINNQNDFLLVLVGESVTLNKDKNYIKCGEVRLYSLSHIVAPQQPLKDFIPEAVERVKDEIVPPYIPPYSPNTALSQWQRNVTNIRQPQSTQEVVTNAEFWNRLQNYLSDEAKNTR